MPKAKELWNNLYLNRDPGDHKSESRKWTNLQGIPFLRHTYRISLTFFLHVNQWGNDLFKQFHLQNKNTNYLIA